MPYPPPLHKNRWNARSMFRSPPSCQTPFASDSGRIVKLLEEQAVAPEPLDRRIAPVGPPPAMDSRPRSGRFRAVSRRYHVRPYGCQMNLHDTEKVENLLHHAGWRPADGLEDAELLLVNTCSIREKAEHRLASDLGVLRTWRDAAPGRVLGVGGCVAQQEGDALLRRFPQLDFVFGTHNLRLVPELAEAAAAGARRAETAESRSLARFDLPERHPAFAGHTPGRAWLTVMEGCDLFCSFCIVPRTRGREISRPAAEIVREARRLPGV